MKWFKNCFKKKNRHSKTYKLKVAEILFNQGIDCYQNGYFQTAYDAFAACLSECEDLVKQGRTDLLPDLIQTHLNLGICLYDLGNLPAAHDVYKNCLNEYENLIKQGRTELLPSLAQTRLNLGICLYDLGNLPAAYDAYKNCLNEYENLIKQGRTELLPSLALTHMNLGFCLSDVNIGNYPAANIQYQAALKILQQLQTEGKLCAYAIKMIWIIANWYRNSHHPNGPDNAKALQLAQQGLDWLDNLLNCVSNDVKGILLEQNQCLFYLAVDLALELNQPEQAYTILERSKSSVLVEQILRQGVEPGNKVSESLRQQYHQLRQELRELLTCLGFPQSANHNELLGFNTCYTYLSSEQEAELLKEQQAVEQKLDQVQQQIAEQDSAFGEAIQPISLNFKQIKALLPTKTLAIALEQRTEFMYLYAISSQGIQAPLRVEIKLLELFERVNQFQNKLREKTYAAVRDICNWLTEQLSAVVKQLLKGHEDFEILFIPHQFWHLLPLHLIEINDELLVNKYPIRYIPALGILHLIKERPSAKQEQDIIVANPWSKELEREYIYKLQSQKEKFYPREHSMITACETKQIKQNIAEKYIGLASRFLFAGAHNVLVILWPVDDSSTRLLIEDFYQCLNQGLTPTLALSEAQRQLREMSRNTAEQRLGMRINRGQRPYQEPYYWSGFMIMGDGL